MNKDLNAEYHAMIQKNLPDLWDRIAAALPAKNAASENEALEAGGQKTSAESPADLEAARRRKRTRIYRMVGVAAAACVCALIAIPTALNFSQRNAAQSQAVAAAGAPEMAEARVEEAVMEETAMEETAAAYGFEEIEEMEEAALEESTNGGWGSVKESEAADASDAGAQDMAKSAVTEAEEAAAAEVPQESAAGADDPAEGGAGSETAGILYREVAVEPVSVELQPDGTLRCEAVLKQNLSEAGLVQGDRIIIVTNEKSPADLVQKLDTAFGEQLLVNLRQEQTTEENTVFLLVGDF